MRIRRSFLGWGIFLILAGGIPLAVRAGYLTEQQVSGWWQLWPLILIGIGLGLVLSRTRFGLIGGVIVAVTLGLMVGGLLSGGVASTSVASCGSTTGTVAFPERQGSISNSGTVDLQLDCGTIDVTAASGDAWQIAGRSADGDGPDVSADASSLRIRSADQQGPFWLAATRETWQVTLPGGPRLDLDVQVNAGEAKLVLAGATLGTMDLQTNAGSATVDLTSVGAIDDIDFELNAGSIGVTLPDVSMTGSIHLNAGSARICAPPAAGLRFRTGDSFLGSYDFGGHGLVQDGTTWTTPGFDDATVRIDLETTANAGSIQLDPEDGCG